jgi:hypothetical protein
LSLPSALFAFKQTSFWQIKRSTISRVFLRTLILIAKAEAAVGME